LVGSRDNVRRGEHVSKCATDGEDRPGTESLADGIHDTYTRCTRQLAHPIHPVGGLRIRPGEPDRRTDDQSEHPALEIRQTSPLAPPPVATPARPAQPAHFITTRLPPRR